MGGGAEWRLCDTGSRKITWPRLRGKDTACRTNARSTGAFARRAAHRSGGRVSCHRVSKADILEAWRTHLVEGRRRSEHTVRAYCAAARRLIEATASDDFEALADIDAARLRTHLAERRQDGLSNASAARELSALKSFLGFARTHGSGPGRTRLDRRARPGGAAAALRRRAPHRRGAVAPVGRSAARGAPDGHRQGRQAACRPHPSDRSRCGHRICPAPALSHRTGGSAVPRR